MDKKIEQQLNEAVEDYKKKLSDAYAHLDKVIKQKELLNAKISDLEKINKVGYRLIIKEAFQGPMAWSTIIAVLFTVIISLASILITRYDSKLTVNEVKENLSNVYAKFEQNIDSNLIALQQYNDSSFLAFQSKLQDTLKMVGSTIISNSRKEFVNQISNSGYEFKKFNDSILINNKAVYERFYKTMEDGFTDIFNYIKKVQIYESELNSKKIQRQTIEEIMDAKEKKYNYFTDYQKNFFAFYIAELTDKSTLSYCLYDVYAQAYSNYCKNNLQIETNIEISRLREIDGIAIKNFEKWIGLLRLETPDEVVPNKLLRYDIVFSSEEFNFTDKGLDSSLSRDQIISILQKKLESIEQRKLLNEG